MNPAVTLIPPSLAADTINVAYNQTITAGGGTGSISLAVSSIQNPITGLVIPVSGTQPDDQRHAYGHGDGDVHRHGDRLRRRHEGY